VNVPSFLGRFSRAVAFARHMPLHRLARRAELEAKRRVLQHAGSLMPRAGRGDAPVPEVSANPPLPVFRPRGGRIARTGDGWRFHFLNRAMAVARQVDWQAGGPGAEHQLWRMNLHYMEYLEEAPDADLSELMAQWIVANPPYRPGYWRDAWSSYTVALRTVVWMQQLALRGGRIALARRTDIVASLAAQVRFLAANLETDIGGNHLIKNIKALIWAGAFFTGGERRGWRALGLRLLEQQLARQVLADGVHYERSPSYHAQVLADLIDIRHALGRDPLSGKLDAAILAMAQVATDLAHPDGGPALFNDAGLTMSYAPDECLDACERLLGARPQPRRVFALADAGYFGLRTADTCVIADCGPIAPDDLPAHGHGDVLSLECAFGGKRFVVDQGVHQYYAGARRQAARSAASHNTLCFEGADQADFFGSFRCGRRPSVEVRRYEARAGGFVLEGAHDGFSGLPGKPRHVRSIEAGTHRIEIRDTIEGCPDRAARIATLLHPECEVVLESGAARVTRGACTIHLSTDRGLAIEPAVWWPDLGVEMSTHRLVTRLEPGAKHAATTIEVLTA